ncbi:uncharacterized protein BYT42DRAFT_553673 [Radiomyces spectabilis]|uniref:uncharacterized protein n=1 Tax=Radiomyces spectabilis TaxID=64574 RepID=UPI00221E8F91|nr:uncharacterized protein BYT42DRAFT_553673 [Radiomyces spectabilis]KAI8394196.1 hypothetical protein BYT42DRAFT_553673 [Radiomyces spectabilis]
MGNSHSLDHAVDKGIKIFKEIKHLRDELNHSSSNDVGSYQHQDIGPSYQQVQEEHDDDDYSRLRALAHEEALKRNDCYERSQAAYRDGDGALAKELSVQGHEHDDRMKQYNQQAADRVFEQKNQDRPSNEIDLHGLYVSEASQKVEEAIRRCQSEGQDHLVIIVGKGLHSPNHIAKLKPAIIDLVKKYNVNCQPNIPNPGCLYVEFGKGTGDLSWLDRFINGMDQNRNSDNCVIM